MSKRSWARAALSRLALPGSPVVAWAGSWPNWPARGRRARNLPSASGGDLTGCTLTAPATGRELVFTDRVLVTLAVLRLQIPHAALAAMFGIDRSTLTRAVHEVGRCWPGGVAPPRRPAATHPGRRLRLRRRTQDHATDRRQRASSSAVPRRASPDSRHSSPARRRWTPSVHQGLRQGGEALSDQTSQPSHQHDQTALRTDGIDDLLQRFPDVRSEMDADYRGLHRDHPGQVGVPPKKPAKDTAPEVTEAWERARHTQSSMRICIEHAIADSETAIPATLDRQARVAARDHPGDRLAGARPRRHTVTRRHQPIAHPPHRKHPRPLSTTWLGALVLVGGFVVVPAVLGEDAELVVSAGHAWPGCRAALGC